MNKEVNIVKKEGGNRNKYSVADSVWVATAIIALEEKYYNSDNPNQKMMYFKKRENFKKAKEL